MTDTEYNVNLNQSECPKGVTENDEFEKYMLNLKDLCKNNADYFSHDNTENGQRMYLSFMAILDNMESLDPKVQRIKSVMHVFDFSETVPGNGFRSFMSVVESAIKYAIELNIGIKQKRESMLFRKTSSAKDIESCSHLLSSLDVCLKHLETMLEWSVDGNLFPNEDHSPDELLTYAEDINQYCFYGRCLGFQYCESLRNVLKVISLAMAIFSEAYYSQGSFVSKATTSFLTSTKYVSDPELRAKRIVNITTNAGVDFCKAFWFLSENELMNQIPSVVSSSVAVSKLIHLPTEPLSINFDGNEINVPIPSSYIGKKSVQVRLISQSVHEGMIGEAKNNKNTKPPSSGLLIHCHGGGFVAQSSKSHESYLRDWAKALKVPILSIDYSLAPEAPFPRALEEVTYAYCWALKNTHLLGSTGEHIVAAGDSAGANLILTSSLKCINLGIPPPKGLFLAYMPCVVNFVPSPSRMLCMMDPLLPFGFLLRCLKAYAVPDPNQMCKDFAFDNNSDTESFEEITESDLQELQAHKSPISETSDTLTYGSLSSNLNEENEKDVDLNQCDIEKSEKYVSDFLEKYVLDSDTETEALKITAPSMKESTSSSSIEYSFHNRVSTFVSTLKSHFNQFMGNDENSKPSASQESVLPEMTDTKIKQDFKFTVPQNPYMSPILASDDLLKQLPPTSVLSVELDPCLDDCVMFAKKLKYLHKDVTLDVLTGLPHGFLNFSMLSKEAHEGSLLCIKRIKELFDLPKKNTDESLT
ncbi:hypothetical protein WA026_013907 [Henosepilachna vigintioctopunctata]|uniref:Hormone-sensitive lipase n=1 Tax=Henosepilachna vigintioctopunctata TaxID=420089 RepID=A0AAW1U798_9CUCU